MRELLNFDIPALAAKNNSVPKFPDTGASFSEKQLCESGDPLKEHGSGGIAAGKASKIGGGGGGDVPMARNLQCHYESTSYTHLFHVMQLMMSI